MHCDGNLAPRRLGFHGTALSLDFKFAEENPGGMKNYQFYPLD